MHSLIPPLRFLPFLGQGSRLWVPTELLTLFEGIHTVLRGVVIVTGRWVQISLSLKVEIFLKATRNYQWSKKYGTESPTVSYNHCMTLSEFLFLRKWYLEPQFFKKHKFNENRLLQNTLETPRNIEEKKINNGNLHEYICLMIFIMLMFFLNVCSFVVFFFFNFQKQT